MARIEARRYRIRSSGKIRRCLFMIEQSSFSDDDHENQYGLL